MKLICETMKDIDCKLNIFYKERERLARDENKFQLDKVNTEIDRLEGLRKKYIDNLSKMDGIEYRLYSYILQGYNSEKAIEKVGEENYLNGVKPTSRTRIIPYYKKIKNLF